MEAIKKALEGSEVVSVKDEMISRQNPYKPVDQKVHDEKTIHAEGFPTDAELDEILAFFNEFAPVAIVRRRVEGGDNKKFTGCLWVEFEKLEDAVAVVQKELKFKERPLKLKNKLDFVAELEASKKARLDKVKVEYEKGCLLRVTLSKPTEDAVAKIESLLADVGEIKQVEYDEGKRCATVQFSEALAQAAVEKFEKPQIEDDQVTLQIIDGDDEKRFYISQIKKEKENKADYDSDKIIKFEVEGEVACEDKIAKLKEWFGKFGDVKFVDFDAPFTSGFARFKQANATEVIAKIAEEVPFEGIKFVMKALAGDEEKAYWDVIMANSKANKKRSYEGGRGRGRGGKRRKYR